MDEHGLFLHPSRVSLVEVQMDSDFFDLPYFGDVDATSHVDDLSLQNWDVSQGKQVMI